MARPTDYTPELVEKAKAYSTSYEQQGDVVPSIEGMAHYLGISRDTVYEWAKEHEEFSDIVDKLRTSKSRALQNGGLNNTLNASVAKLLLGHEGYRESQDVTSDGKALPTPLLHVLRNNDSNSEDSETKETD